MHVLIDALVLALSYVLSWYCYVRLGVMNNHPERGILPPATYMMALLYIVPGYLLLYYAFNLYASKRFQGRRLEFANILKANTVGFLVWLASLYMVRQVHFSRGMLCIFFVLNVTLETIVRNLIHYILSNMWKHGRNQKQILMVGYSRATEEYIDRIIANPEWGYLVRGILDDHVKAGTMYRGVKVLGRINNLSVILPENKLDEIAITLGLNEYFRLEEIVAMCEKSGVHTVCAGLPQHHSDKAVHRRPAGTSCHQYPLCAAFQHVQRDAETDCGYFRRVRGDHSVLTGDAVFLHHDQADLTGSADLRQTRVGLHNKPFEMYKFRSMEVQTEEKEKKAWTVKNDPRVTGFGKFMRHTSIDELPQLFNILKGDMSLVGPRPERLSLWKNSGRKSRVIW